MHSNADPAQPNAGFSLVELLVALSVFSLLSVVLLSAIQQVRPLYQASRTASARTELNTVADFLEETIAGAVPLVIIGSESSGQRLAFTGDRTSMRFVGIVRVGSDQTGLREISIRFLSGESQLSLETNLRRPAEREPTQIPIVEGIENASFEYLAEQRTDGSRTWLTAWSQPETLPTAVRITIRRSGSEPTHAVSRIIFLRNATHSTLKSAS